MWIAKHFRLLQAYSELESVAAERTAELQRLTQRLLRLQDEERRKLARDLHDTTGQTLAALNISVSLLQQQCKEMPAMLTLVTEVAQHAEQAIEEIRTMAYLLHPPLLDEVGFACAAEWYIEGFAKRSGIDVTAEIPISRGTTTPEKCRNRPIPCAAGRPHKCTSSFRGLTGERPFST